MKKSLLFALSTLLTIGFFVEGESSAARACPYDILAMCCTETKNGKCTRWQNCCEVLQAPSNDDDRAGRGGPDLVAPGSCARSCDRRFRDRSSRERCYSSCASRNRRQIAARSPRNISPTPNLIARPSSGHRPTLSQIGSSQAQVPMKHGSCGVDCNTHVLAVENGNLDMKLQVGMTCPAGTSVNHLSFKPQGQNATTVVAAPTGSSSFSKSLHAQPFSKGELETACRQAMGGSWPSPGSHHNQSQTVQTILKKTVQVWGQCTGWVNKTKRTYPVTLSLTCTDQSWFVPEG